MALKDNLELCLKFEQDAGSQYNDSSGNGVHFPINGSPTFIDNGKVDSALRFNANAADYLQCANQTQLNNRDSITLQAWIRVDTNPAAAGAYTVFAKTNGQTNGWGPAIMIREDSGDIFPEFQIHFAADGSDVKRLIGTNALTLGTWHLITMTFDKSTQIMSLYLDEEAVETLSTGKAADTQMIGNDTAPIANIARVGQNGAAGNAYDGDVDELCFWGRALSEAEHDQVYNSGTGLHVSAVGGVTERVSAIEPGGGGDYTTLTAFEAGEQAIASDLSAANQKVIGRIGAGNAWNTSLTTIEGWICDSDNFIQIEPDPDDRHDRSFATAGGVATIQPTGTNGGIVVQEKFVNIQGIIFKHLGTSGNLVQFDGASKSCTIEECLFRAGSRALDITDSNYTEGQNQHVFRNNIAILQTLQNVRNNSTAVVNVLVTNNTLRTNGANSVCVQSTQANALIDEDNNYLSPDGASSAAYSGASITKGANSATSNTEATTASLRNIPYNDTATFVDVSTSGSEDLGLKNLDSGLVAVAAKLTTRVTNDVEGVARPTASEEGVWDIGADQISVNPTAFVAPRETALPMRGFKGISLKTAEAPKKFTVEPARLPQRVPRGPSHLLDWLGGG